MVGGAAPAAQSPGFIEFDGTGCKYSGNSNAQYPNSRSWDSASNHINGFLFGVLAITSSRTDGIEALDFAVVCGARGGTPS